MTSDELRQKFLAFFERRGHKIIPSASSVPENDPPSLFTTAGMQPLVPYLLGQPHPAGTRLVDVQKCVRTGDIDEVGDNRHLTFFEMLGNWSLGDYFKKESLNWSFEFLTSKEEGLGMDPSRLYATVFKGEDGIPRDDESIAIWQDIFSQSGLENGIAGDDTVIKRGVRIIPLGKDDNFWIAGQTGPCGGGSEIFYDTRPADGEMHGKFQDLVDSGRLMEVWNNVFMEFNKTAEGEYEPLEKKNVDTGMGLERTLAVLNGHSNAFECDVFEPLLKTIRGLSKNDDPKAARIMADHLKAAVFMLADGVLPSNTDRGYVLRRLIRRAMRNAKKLDLEEEGLPQVVQTIIDIYVDAYPYLRGEKDRILSELNGEIDKLQGPYQLIEQYKIDLLAARQDSRLAKKIKDESILTAEGKASGAYIFQNYQMYGAPADLAFDVAKELDIPVDTETFARLMLKHQEVSRAGAEQKFKGGLADQSDEVVKYHTATHLLQQALTEVLGPQVAQKGSNITAERLRFDFTQDEKLTDEQKAQVEKIVNEKIASALPVNQVILPKVEAEATGARHLFGEKYGDQVSIFFIGSDLDSAYSKEFCGGPHVKNTSELGHFKIAKEEAVAKGIRRIKAILE